MGFVCLQCVRAGEPLGLDQGLFATFGRWLRDGWVPYRDLFDSKPPLHLYTWVPAWAIGPWLFEALWLAATMIVAVLALRRWCCAWAGLVTAVLVLAGLWAPGLGGYWTRLQAEELLALPVLGAAWLAVIALERPRAAFWCGVLVGAAGLYKIPALDDRHRMAGAVARAASHRMVCGRRRRAVARRRAVVRRTRRARRLHRCRLLYQRHWIAMIDPPWGDVVHGFVSTALPALAPLWVAAVAGIAVTWRTIAPAPRA